MKYLHYSAVIFFMSMKDKLHMRYVTFTVNTNLNARIIQSPSVAVNQTHSFSRGVHSDSGEEFANVPAHEDACDEFAFFRRTPHVELDSNDCAWIIGVDFCGNKAAFGQIFGLRKGKFVARSLALPSENTARKEKLVVRSDDQQPYSVHYMYTV